MIAGAIMMKMIASLTTRGQSAYAGAGSVANEALVAVCSFPFFCYLCFFFFFVIYLLIFFCFVISYLVSLLSHIALS
jgi:hypothetical protein